MTTLGLQHCFHHAEREAVARCPQCGRIFCRECITEHDERILCASCLQAELRAESAPKVATRQIPWALLLAPVRIMAGICIAWLCFYTIGRLLLAIPSNFHAETLWGGAGEMIDPG